MKRKPRGIIYGLQEPQCCAFRVSHNVGLRDMRHEIRKEIGERLFQPESTQGEEHVNCRV